MNKEFITLFFILVSFYILFNIFSPRLDYVPMLEKDKLDQYYKAGKKLSDMYNSEKNRIDRVKIPDTTATHILPKI